MILPVVYYGNPLLRKKAEEVKGVTEEIRQLALDMVETMDKKKGVGLAAPQVGRLIRLFVLRNYIEGEDGHLHLSERPECFINPKITLHKAKPVSDIEGCLSIPGIHEKVARPLHLTVEALDLDGKPFKEEVFGYKARIILHENDHLNGVLFVDRLPKPLRAQLEPVLRNIKLAANQSAS